MTESVCSCCQLFGKPAARVNFIIATGVPSSLLYRRIRHVLRLYSDNESSIPDSELTNHDLLQDIGDPLFHPEKRSCSVDPSETETSSKCCHGLRMQEIVIGDESDTDRIQTLESMILRALHSSESPSSETEEPLTESPTWVLFYGSSCLKPIFLNIFLQMDQPQKPLHSFRFTVLAFLVDERRLFENWIFEDKQIDDYNSETYPDYERNTRSFFRLLESSIPLQQNTLLFREVEEFSEADLKMILRGLYQNRLTQHTATNYLLRLDLSKLLGKRQRTSHHVRSVRRELQRQYQKNVECQLKTLVEQLQNSTTATSTVRRIVHLVLDELERINPEEKRAYSRQLVAGSNTICAHLVRYALELIRTDPNSPIPLLYAIIMSICSLVSHYYFRHELFNSTPEIFTLSLELLSQRQYHLAIAGLCLCARILRADQNEHKYAIAYLKHDPLAARKILDAILWLLSPYTELVKIWREENKMKINTDSETKHDENSKSPSEEFERRCFRYANILLERQYFRYIAGLFYGSTDHCRLVTPEDVRRITETIKVLTDRKMSCWVRGDGSTPSSLSLVVELCALLMPIFLYGTPSVCSAILDDTHLPVYITDTIRLLMLRRTSKTEAIEICLRFYTRFVLLSCKESDDDDDSNDDDSDQLSDDSNLDKNDKAVSDVTLTPEKPIQETSSLTLTADLISEHYQLYKQFQNLIADDERSVQQEELKKLFDTEWKKIDVLQLKRNYDQLQKEHQASNDELERLREQLKRSLSEADQLREEKRRMAYEIDRLKLIPHTTVNPNTTQSINPVTKGNTNNPSNDIIDQLRDLSPYQITSEQAKQCIEEIHHRRTMFDDSDMRKSICGSLKHLGSDLYSSSVHFLHELIQNAEDNSYDDSIDPSLRIQLSHDHILFSNNEQGLRASDVLALCSLAVSTKTAGQTFIGEKGVGFKSVFAASNRPTVISRAWKFYFQVPGVDAMAYITPIWLEEKEIPECVSQEMIDGSQCTYLYLPLKLSMDARQPFIDEVAKAVDPCILLNMRRLKKLEIADKRHGTIHLMRKEIMGSTTFNPSSDEIFEGCTFFNLIGKIIRLNTSSGQDDFRVYTCQINIPSYIEQRPNPQTSLTLAFPCDEKYAFNATVYTGLPVCDLGFNFMFNANFQLVTNRETVRENSELNTFLRDHFAVLFIYLLMKDPDLKKEMNRFCPLSNLPQIRHSSWWLKMVDRIHQLINKYISDILGISAGKLIRYANPDLASLVSNEQLSQCVNIEVIDSHSGFLTMERLKSFHIPIQFVSIKDILECFPNRDDQSNAHRQEFWLWAKQQDERWWMVFFRHIYEGMTEDVSNSMLQKPIFLVQGNKQRGYLPSNPGSPLNLFIHDDPSITLWKRQITRLHYRSQNERNALLHSKQVQLMDDDRIVDIILKDHLQRSLSSMTMDSVPADCIEEIWQDLSFLQAHRDKVDKTRPIVVPTGGRSGFTLITNATLPTIFGVSMKKFMDTKDNKPMIAYPYYLINGTQLSCNLRWESFFLEMNCQRPSIILPQDYTIEQLPVLPSFTMFANSECAEMAEQILRSHTITTQESLRQFPMVANLKDEESNTPVSLTFDQSLVRDINFVPRILIPSHCHRLALQLGARVDYDLPTCVSVLQFSSAEKVTDIDHYIHWLGRLQLYVHEQYHLFDSTDFLLKCQLYLPDQQRFASLKQLLIIDDQNAQRRGIALVCKYHDLQLISPTKNQCYWQFKELFRRLGCQNSVSISNISASIQAASSDNNNFFALGDGRTILSEEGLETMITLLQYLEHSILECVTNEKSNGCLYTAIVENKHSKAPCGSREDLKWRFSLMSNDIPNQLRAITKMENVVEQLPLLTIDRQLVKKRLDHIIYACFETKIIQNLARDVGKRSFISPVITRTCPLLLTVLGIDYVERRGKVEWTHKNNNLEYRLSQLSKIFQDAMNDSHLEVSISRYVTTFLYLSDTIIIDTIDDQSQTEIQQWMMESDYPFWVFNKNIHLCVNDPKDINAAAIIATSALATLLHKRQHLPFEEAKVIARQKVDECDTFRSDSLSELASAPGHLYSYLDILFPTDHSSFETMTISLGRHCRIERDSEEGEEMNMAIDQLGEHQIYQARVQTQDHRQQNDRFPKNWRNPIIVDSAEHIQIGRNAEHFFFAYLRKLYGPNGVTPMSNWRSSACLAVYPDCGAYVNDALGYDFELQDTRGEFAQSLSGRTMKCYFEVKGTSGLFHRIHSQFYVSRNEYEACDAIARDPNRKQREAYFIAIVENCLDLKKISLGPIIQWSADLNSIEREIESYRCKLRPPNAKPAESIGKQQQSSASTATVPKEQRQWQAGGKEWHQHNQPGQSFPQQASGNAKAKLFQVDQMRVPQPFYFPQTFEQQYPYEEHSEDAQQYGYPPDYGDQWSSHQYWPQQNRTQHQYSQYQQTGQGRNSQMMLNRNDYQQQASWFQTTNNSALHQSQHARPSQTYEHQQNKPPRGRGRGSNRNNRDAQ